MKEQEREDPRQLKGKRQLEAREAGSVARRDGKRRDDYPASYARRSLVACWQAGWDDAATTERVKEAAAKVAAVPRVEYREPAMQTPAGPDPTLFWPSDQPMPERYRKPPVIPPVPCKNCKRLFLDTRGRAVTVTSTWRDPASGVLFTYLLCGCCGGTFKMPTEE